MIDAFQTYWPHVLAALSFLLGVPAAIHAAMTKQDVRAAAGWVGVIVLSPIVGALFYAVAGINRMRVVSIEQQRTLIAAGRRRGEPRSAISQAYVDQHFGERFSAMMRLGDRVCSHVMTDGNRIAVLDGGDEAYDAMIRAIEGARRSVLLETYIFDRDRAGARFVTALVDAVSRGVAVRVLIDAVGVRYSVPSIVGELRDGGVAVKAFNGNIIMGLRLPYANLRTHRKILVVDGHVGFMGGMNIREAFVSDGGAPASARDTHFRVRGPAVAGLFHAAAEDWQFASDEPLEGPAWALDLGTDDMPHLPIASGSALHAAVPDSPHPDAVEPMLVRTVPSGPDRSMETNHRMLMGAFSVAHRSIRIMSPYFLPDRELISALVTAARRGVEVDIVVPGNNNLRLVDRAMTSQFDQVLRGDCRVWRAHGGFDHSKLLTVDDRWAFVGSSNLDSRSLRLNFEIDLEVLDTPFAEIISARIGEALKSASPVLLDDLRRKPWPSRILNRALWLASPLL
ncbi:phospholipase D-like domain-containing protein [Ensifer soli]|uniref:phospholipase D-like domain-containing protein n=1 Tax=Ciceribacter sp. sgz301302 TaxID=3342379 RepID=UPI0035B6E758